MNKVYYKSIAIVFLTFIGFWFNFTSYAWVICEQTIFNMNKWNNFFDNKNYFEAIDAYQSSLMYFCEDNNILFSVNYNLALSYWKLNQNSNAALYFGKSLRYTNNDKDISDINNLITNYSSLAKDDDLKNTSATNDPYSYKQYYLRSLSIVPSWEKIENPKAVIVAVIDDGVWINAPDLKNNIIWNVVDFTWDGLKNYADGSHWTMVAWIIWSEINNKIWVSWIAKNVKIMPLRVFWSWSIVSEDRLINAINYAVENKANIINISLWQTQFYWTNKFDEAIKNAYDNWVIVVIAAWNWDLLSSNQIWLDTSLNSISPVCNNWWTSKYSFWVWALKQNWDKAEWSNYWNCVSFWLPWENITSVSVPSYTDNYWYNTSDWTSFSAPILSWIIALWYNKYWYVPFEIIKSELEKSISDFSWEQITWTKNTIKIINTDKYLTNLWLRLNEINEYQKKLESRLQNKLENKSNFNSNVIGKLISSLFNIQIQFERLIPSWKTTSFPK